MPDITPTSFSWYPNPLELFALQRELTMISDFYGDKRANRSQVPLMNHIIEGISILKYLNASHQAKAAFCIHPLLQSDADLAVNFSTVMLKVDADVMGLAMEYRSVANEYLSLRNITHINEIRLSPLKEVNDMLVADKVQNYKDFILYHHGTHPRSTELHYYFRNWLMRLDCSDVMDEFYPEWRNYE